MCGFAGYLDLRGERPADARLLRRMSDRLVHRGPDSSGYFTDGSAGLAFRRLSIIDLAGGDQPIYSEDGSLVLVCNGEIYNYKELRAGLEKKGHRFSTETDVEVLVHLYEDEGARLLERLNGQFAFAIYDRRRRELFLARDQFGVCPLYYALTDDVLLFGSEIKALLAHPLAPREVDLTALDQVLSFPGIVSPRTIFRGVESLPAGHCLTARDGDLRVAEYWDLDYPREGEADDARPESYYVERLAELLARSVKYRLQADVPVGFYLSGGLDSSLIAALTREVSPAQARHSFSIGFTDREISESAYQRLMARHVGSEHHEIIFDWSEIEGRLPRMVEHCESPVKESFNTCSLALSESARRAGVKVVLAGEGADELFAGYMGYRFDQSGMRGARGADLEAALEDEIRERLWGSRDIFYEVDQHPLREVKSALYSAGVAERFADFECVNFAVVNRERLRGRHFIHQRSYLDFKLRLADHLLTEHGDRMVMANSVEGRYPFLDIELVEFARTVPPGLKLNGFSEKYLVKRVAEGRVPERIVRREKFGFRAPGSPYLLGQRVEWIEDQLAHERVRRQGYFNPETVERLKARYSRPGFALNPHTESDLLMLVLTFNLLLELFELPSLN
jgi:asparagine synthase (glutamine-hydrolysing)